MLVLAEFLSGPKLSSQYGEQTQWEHFGLAGVSND